MADLVFVKADLNHVVHCCEELAKVDFCNEHRTNLQAHLDSALVRYRRCFKNGVRTLIVEFLKTLTEDERQLHDYMISYCDRHIAHSVNNFESPVPVVFVGIDADGTIKRAGIGTHGSLLFLISKEQTEQFRKLALHFIDQVDAWDKELRAIVTKEASELSDEELLQLEDALGRNRQLNVSKPRPSTVSKSSKD